MILMDLTILHKKSAPSTFTLTMYKGAFSITVSHNPLADFLFLKTFSEPELPPFRKDCWDVLPRKEGD